MCVREGCLLALNGGEAVCESMRGLVSFVPWAWCHLCHVYAASMSLGVCIDMGIPMHALSYTHLS